MEKKITNEECVTEDGFKLLTIENEDGTHIKDLILNTIEAYPELFEPCEKDDIYRYNKETMREFIRRKCNGK